ncbi:MAG: phosphomannose isomerase type II C-terminal cupin domain [Akkermansia sp.]|nr:phosphomannose isomerase type II C-terminal cupin domain [Akkermansia sp.]
MNSTDIAYEVGDQGERPWGEWQVLDKQSHVVVKKILVYPGERLSLQRHQHRTERWIITEGVATAYCDGAVTKLAVGESIWIPKRSIHRLSNEESGPLALIEIQLGDILTEEDIERFTDDYGRVDGV